MNVDQYRVEETAQWFALGFWGINASDYVSLHGVPETLGISSSKCVNGSCWRTEFVAVCELSEFQARW